MGARIDAHPSIRQQVALKLANGRQRSKPLQAAGSGGFTAMDVGLGSADYAVRGMTGNVKGYQTPARDLAVRRARWAGGRLPDEAVAGPGKAMNELRPPSPRL